MSAAGGPLRLVVSAHKGGVGKTMVAVSLAGAIAETGRRTLLVDVDPQGAATAGVGAVHTTPGLYGVLLGDVPASAAIGSAGVANLDLLPADLDLAGAELALPQRAGWQTRLREVLAEVDDDYDVVILDSAPGLGVLPFVALVAGDAVLIPATPASVSLRTLGHVIDTAASAREFNAALVVLGIVPSIVDGHRTLHRDEVLAAIDEQWPGWTLPKLARRVVYEDAAANGEPITHFAPRSVAAAAVRDLAREVLSRGGA